MGACNTSEVLPMEYEAPYFVEYDQDLDRYGWYKIGDLIVLIITILICMIGTLGNGHVIWLLGFHVKRNPFSSHILNMAVADFAMLLFLSWYLILLLADSIHGLSHRVLILEIVLQMLWHFAYTASLSFLTIISIQRCLLVLFPTWYHRSCPSCLFSRLSLLVWILCAMMYGMQISFYLVYHMELGSFARITFIVNFYFFPPLLVVSTLVLLAKICCNRQQRPPGHLNVVILLSLLFFYIFCGLWIITHTIHTFEYCLLFSLVSYLICSVTSSLKPIFYYFVGKQCRYSSTEPLKVLLQRVFQDEVYYVEENELTDANRTDEVSC